MSQVSCHVVNEAMNRHFRDAVADDRVHNLSHGAEWWFVYAREIQLRLGSGERVDRKLGRHERKQTRRDRGLPFEQQPGNRRRHGVNFLLDVLDGNAYIGLDPDAATVDTQFSSDRLRPEAAALLADWNTVSAFCLKASRTCS
jgi:hypothetical protein